MLRCAAFFPKRRDGVRQIPLIPSDLRALPAHFLRARPENTGFLGRWIVASCNYFQITLTPTLSLKGERGFLTFYGINNITPVSNYNRMYTCLQHCQACSKQAVSGAGQIQQPRPNA
jgi:hypothetical protein